MEIEITVTSKGQITLPKNIRNRLGVHKGDTLFVESVRADRVVLGVRRECLKPADTPEDVVAMTAGLWKDRDYSDTDLAELRHDSGRRLRDIEDPA